jgi:hypothetical protein
MAYFTSDAAPFRFAGAGFAVATVFAALALLRLSTLPRPARTMQPVAPGPHGH